LPGEAEDVGGVVLRIPLGAADTRELAALDELADAGRADAEDDGGLLGGHATRGDVRGLHESMMPQVRGRVANAVIL
jgi:hypothetical protein